MSFDLRHLRHAVALAEAGNFSRAADMVGITQPALSRSVAGLEAELGFALFDRTSGAVIPTMAGADFLKEARKLLLQARQLQTDAASLAAGEGGTLSFGLGPLLASLILPDLLALLTSRFPGLRVMPMIASAEDLIVALADRRIELCLVSESMLLSDKLKSRSVGSILLAMMARAGHPLAGNPRLSLRDLADYPLATGSTDGREVRNAVPPSSIVCENFRILREAVQRSDIIWLSSPALASVGGAEQLVELEVQDFPAFRHAILVVRMEQRTPSPAGRQAEATIEAMLASIP